MFLPLKFSLGFLREEDFAILSVYINEWSRMQGFVVQLRSALVPSDVAW